MTETGVQPLPGRTTTLTLLTDWPLSKPNRDLSGDQKAAVVGGVRRHVQSSANRKALWRRVRVPGSLLWLAENNPEAYAGRLGMSVRTKYVAGKLIAYSTLAPLAAQPLLASGTAPACAAFTACETRPTSRGSTRTCSRPPTRPRPSPAIGRK